MKQDMIFSESEMNNNPLFRKMRERFVCNGHMTIGEIMLYRAEKEEKQAENPLTNTTRAPLSKPEAPVPAPAVATEVTRPTSHNGHRALALTCIAVALCAVVLLAFMLPVFNNFSANAHAADPSDNLYVERTNSQVDSVAEPSDNTVYETESSFDNVLDAMSSAFGD